MSDDALLEELVEEPKYLLDGIDVGDIVVLRNSGHSTVTKVKIIHSHYVELGFDNLELTYRYNREGFRESSLIPTIADIIGVAHANVVVMHGSRQDGGGWYFANCKMHDATHTLSFREMPDGTPIAETVKIIKYEG